MSLELRWQVAAIEALQTSTEQYLVTTFEAVNLLALHAKRVTGPDLTELFLS